ncbi:hypothetical protein V5799_006853 [Amblyomma americanum]|uniref:Uncharacterized protein n=1 Tax=Amblyomma americanum TaxID=6943 RepID=A0AAQ4DV76_AMBAM
MVASAPRAVSDGRSYTSSPGSSVANTSRPSEHEQQKLRLLQTILMRVEHQGQQLDAILQRLSSSTPQSSCMTEDLENKTGAIKENFAEATRNDVESVIKVWLRHLGAKLKKTS